MLHRSQMHDGFFQPLLQPRFRFRLDLGPTNSATCLRLASTSDGFQQENNQVNRVEGKWKGLLFRNTHGCARHQCLLSTFGELGTPYQKPSYTNPGYLEGRHFKCSAENVHNWKALSRYLCRRNDNLVVVVKVFAVCRLKVVDDCILTSDDWIGCVSSNSEHWCFNTIKTWTSCEFIKRVVSSFVELIHITCLGYVHENVDKKAVTAILIHGQSLYTLALWSIIEVECPVVSLCRTMNPVCIQLLYIQSSWIESWENLYHA